MTFWLFIVTKFLCLFLITLSCLTHQATAETTTSRFLIPPAGLAPEVYFVNLQDGDKVRSPFRVLFGLTRIGIAPAGVDLPSTGHHHLLVNTPLPSDLNKPIPFSDKYRHFGAGQTEAIIELPPGNHSLQLVFADFQHRPFLKTKNGDNIVVFSRKITVEVVK